MSTTVLKTAYLWLALTTTAAAGGLSDLSDARHLSDVGYLGSGGLSGQFYRHACGKAFLVPSVESMEAGICWGLVMGVWHEMQRDARDRNVSMPCPNSKLLDVALAVLERIDTMDKCAPVMEVIARHLALGHCYPEFLEQ